jgi:hypothetical protein
MTGRRSSRRWPAVVAAVIALLLTQVRIVAAEGIINYGGYGVDQAACGTSVLPCATYDFARQQACNASENNQDTYHVYHVYDGFVSTCDMLGGTGREPTGAIERNWSAYFLSMVVPMAAAFAVSLVAATFYYRRLARPG